MPDVTDAQVLAALNRYYVPDISKLIDAGVPASWVRYRTRLPVSYRGKVTRGAFEAGFKAGLEFARIAMDEATKTEATDREVCPQPCEHLSQHDAREGRTCPEHPCTCTDREDGSAAR